MGYYTDHRITAASKWRPAFDEKRMVLVLTVEECECSECCPPPSTPAPFYVEQVAGPLHGWHDHHHPGFVIVERSTGLPVECPRPNKFTSLSADMYALVTKMNEAAGWFDSEPKEHVYEVPAEFDVCDTCSGRGRHVNPSIDADGLSSDDEFWADDRDEETGESRYMRGDYDVPCYGCSGARVIPVPAPSDDPKVRAAIEKFNEYAEADAEFRALCAAERRMGA